MEHSEFVVKCYNKQELAQMYFPDLTIRASVNKPPKVDEEMQAIDE